MDQTQSDQTVMKKFWFKRKIGGAGRFGLRPITIWGWLTYLGVIAAVAIIEVKVENHTLQLKLDLVVMISLMIIAYIKTDWKQSS